MGGCGREVPTSYAFPMSNGTAMLPRFRTTTLAQILEASLQETYAFMTHIRARTR